MSGSETTGAQGAIAILALLALTACGTCDTGDHYISLNSMNGGSWALEGVVTVERPGSINLNQGSRGENLWAHGVPSELFPNGSSLYIVMTFDDSDGSTNVQVAAYNVEDNRKGSLRGLAWDTYAHPAFEGETITTHPKDCGEGSHCGGKKHDTTTTVTLGDGRQLSADSGYVTRNGNAELGNGLSYFDGHQCNRARGQQHIGYVLIRP